MNKGGDITREDIHIFCHIGRTMNNAKIIAKKFLQPMSKLINTLGVFQYFINWIVIVYSVKKTFHKDNNDYEQ